MVVNSHQMTLFVASRVLGIFPSWTNKNDTPSEGKELGEAE